jgi:tetratricopeptide (TPR) repeat protein
MQKLRETADGAYYGRAEAAYRKSLQLNPAYANALSGMAWVTSGRHNFEQSVEWAKKALKVDPNRADVYGLLGDAATEMGDYEAALDHYQKMLDLKPDIASYSRAAHLMFLIGDIKKSTLLWSKATGTEASYAENNAWCLAQWAQLYFAQGAYVPAVQLLTKGLERSPNNYQLLAAMGRVRAAMKDYPAAIESYKKALAVVPQYEVAVALGDLYTLQGNTGEARRSYDLVDVIHQVNQANGIVGDLQTAMFLADHDRDLPRALRLAEAEYKTRPTVYAADTLAWCYFKNGQVTEARKYIARALVRNTPEAMFLFHKGMICAKAGDIGPARKAFYQALSDNPGFDPRNAPIAIRMVQELGATSRDGTQ